jgi:hypothetical protein
MVIIFFMFPFYYSLQGWCINDNNYSIGRTSHSKCTDPKEPILNNTKYLIKGGDHIYYPSKIIDAPLSRFGGKPEIFEPNRLNLLNYYQILNKGLENKNLDESILKIALENNYKDVLEEIKNNLTKEELIKILMTPKNDDLNLIIAFNKNFDFIKDLIDDDLLKYFPDLLTNEKIVKGLKTLLIKKFENNFDELNSDILEKIVKLFSYNDILKDIFFDIFKTYFNKINDLIMANFIEILKEFDLIKDKYFMTNLAGILKIKNSKDQNYFYNQIFIPGALKYFKTLLNDWQSTFVNYPNLLSDVLNEIDTNNIVNEINTSNQNFIKIRLEKLNAIKQLREELNILAK